MRELETSLKQFGEFVLKAQLVKEKAAPYCVRWVRRFLTRTASDESLNDRVRKFCEELEQNGAYQDWQVHQAGMLSASTSSTSSSARMASAAWQHSRGRTGPDGSIGGSRSIALADSNPALRGTTWLMAALIYGGGLRVSECCELRVKDVDFDQGLVFVRGGKGDKDRSTLLAAVGREDLRAHLHGFTCSNEF